MHNNKIYILVIFLNLLLNNVAWGGVFKEISIESLYKTGIINVEKLIYDDSFYLRTNSAQKNLILMKKGKKNKPFSLDLMTLEVEAITKNQWKNAMNEKKAPTCNYGSFIIKNGELKNIYDKNILKPSGNHIINFCINADSKSIFIYSFSGYYKKPKGIGFLATSSSRKIGINFFEVWNVETGKNEFCKKTLSFSKSYWPDLLFWLDDKKLIIFSNNYNKSLIILRY